MFNDAIAGQSLPKRVSTDHDPLFRFHRWLANLRVLEIEELKSVPYAPVSHPFVERLIGPDGVFAWSSTSDADAPDRDAAEWQEFQEWKRRKAAEEAR